MVKYLEALYQNLVELLKSFLNFFEPTSFSFLKAFFNLGAIQIIGDPLGGGVNKVLREIFLLFKL